MPNSTAGRHFAALLGGAAAVLGIGLGELTAALVAPESSPLSVVGSALIDVAPPAAKDMAIALFGTADKIALLTGIAIALLAVAALAGILEWRRPPWGVAIAAGFGGLALVLALTRPDAGTLAWLPAAVAGMAAAISLRQLTAGASRARHRVGSAPGLSTAPQSSPGMPGAAGPPLDRRRLLITSSAVGAAGLLSLAGGGLVQASRGAATLVRSALRLPPPTVPAPPIPAGADLTLPGLSPLVTPTADFYRIDTALVVPRVEPAGWSLRIHGLVEQEVVLTWDELLALPLEESYTTLMCVSNYVGGDLVGNAKWLGYPIRRLLERARPTAAADMVLSRSADGFTASTPLEALTDDRNSILAVGMNDEPLPPEHGFPVRMVVPGLYGYVSATKWVVELEVTRFDRAQGYWTPRGWAARAPVKVQSRIDVPARGSTLAAGAAVIAGVAWHQHVGIAAVEVQIDDGPWQEATLATAVSADTWVQWSLPWQATSGQHQLRCRATNAHGETQTPDQTPPAPDGATGWHEITVDIPS
ncbi:MAG: molybdopterin-dependent oxidoreductase [Propioniciclava sp.]